MEKIIQVPSTLNITEDSYRFLSKLQFILYKSPESHIVLDFDSCRFTHAAFTAYFGGLRLLCQHWGKSLIFKASPNGRIQTYFKRSGLYDFFTSSNSKHTNSNSIPFAQVRLDDDSIINYIDNILYLAPIRLSDDCRALLFKNIYEIFNNAIEHSQALCGVYSCGHWMPTQKQLIFSVYDTGLGIPRRIKRVKPDLSSSEAMNWALKLGTSTLQLSNGVPRGLGLYDLKQFISLNNGALNILSNDVYYSYTGSEQTTALGYDILGTLITITITADYDHIYILRKE